jgi:hypothetical protein
MRGFITVSELEKIFYIFLNSIDCKILAQDKMKLEKGSNLIWRINDYDIENKHDFTKHTYSMLKYLYTNILDK